LPAGYTDGTQNDTRLVLRPKVGKTLIKGAVAIGIFSLFLNIVSNYLHYFMFLVSAFGLVGLYMLVKHASRFEIGEDDIRIKRILGKSNVISYDRIVDMSVSQGFLAKKFDCGSLYLILKGGSGGVNLMGGGKAERLEDIREPNKVYDLISSRLSPFSPG
jgi:membrane protein YdbS with pleckstrin-like domain